MENRKYHLVTGIVLLLAAFGFFLLPLIGYDPFVPIMIAIVLVIVALGVLLMGLSAKK